ncbi:hypothetical protein IMCC21224_112435 [Puniceibacterium sp. IMCC21224]|nr:hypothetical protein IMCC21224_112435 [Puniceibacterium sp. IMCC21224]
MKIQLLVGVFALATSACAYEPAPLPDVTMHDAVTSPTVSARVKYRDPMAGYTYRGPIGPRDWRTVNQEQSEGN